MDNERRFKAFYEEQPPLSFIDELKAPIHICAPEGFGREEVKKGEVLAMGAYIVDSFNDGEGLLETAFDDFARFLNIYKIGGSSFPIHIKREPTDC